MGVQQERLRQTLGGYGSRGCREAMRGYSGTMVRGTGVPWLGCRQGAQWGAEVLELGCTDTMVRAAGSAGSRG